MSHRRKYEKLEQEGIEMYVHRVLEPKGYTCFWIDHNIPNYKLPFKDVLGADIIATKDSDMIFLQMSSWSWETRKAKKLRDTPMPPSVLKEYGVYRKRWKQPGTFYIFNLSGEKIREERV